MDEDRQKVPVGWKLLVSFPFEPRQEGSYAAFISCINKVPEHCTVTDMDTILVTSFETRIALRTT
jgi:hypothetical protein